MAKPIEIPTEKQQRAYDFYVNHPSVSLQDIATFLGVSLSTYHRLRQRWGWPLRGAVMVRRDRHPASETIVPQGEACRAATAPSSLRAAALALAEVTRSRIDALARERGAGPAMDHDRSARSLASYAKTLAAAKALLEQEGSTLDDSEHHHESPRSIHELRDELARHLERVVAEEETRGSHGLVVGG